MPKMRVNTARTVASSMLPPAIRTYPIDALDAGTTLATKYPNPTCASPRMGDIRKAKNGETTNTYSKESKISLTFFMLFNNPSVFN